MLDEALRYSLDPKITLKEIEEQRDPLYDANKYTKLQEWMTENNVWAMVASDKDFHYKLLSIKPPVRIMYYMGDISLLNRKILGIVGPRKMSLYGKQVLESLFTSVINHDVVTISGMAEGVDQLCHQLSRENNIPTIAVLGWGIGRFMKRPNHGLIEQIVADGGLVISEYKLWESPTHYTFPQRNRLIAWLADVLFLPEAGENSGSLITVEYAIAMKKPVYATPWSIFSPTSLGILQAMEAGSVKPVVDLNHFLSTHFASQNIPSRPPTTIILTDQEQLLLSIFSRDYGVEMQDLVDATGGDIQGVIEVLTMLEIKGVVSQEVPGKYVLV